MPNINKGELIIYIAYKSECCEFARKIIEFLKKEGYEKIEDCCEYVQVRKEVIGHMHPARVLAVQIKHLMHENSLGLMISETGIGSVGIVGKHNNRAVPILGLDEGVTKTARHQHDSRIMIIGSNNQSLEKAKKIIIAFLTTNADLDAKTIDKRAEISNHLSDQPSQVTPSKTIISD